MVTTLVASAGRKREKRSLESSGLSHHPFVSMSATGSSTLRQMMVEPPGGAEVRKFMCDGEI